MVRNNYYHRGLLSGYAPQSTQESIGYLIGSAIANNMAKNAENRENQKLYSDIAGLNDRFGQLGAERTTVTDNNVPQLQQKAITGLLGNPADMTSDIMGGYKPVSANYATTGGLLSSQLPINTQFSTAPQAAPQAATDTQYYKDLSEHPEWFTPNGTYVGDGQQQADTTAQNQGVSVSPQSQQNTTQTSAGASQYAITAPKDYQDTLNYAANVTKTVTPAASYDERIKMVQAEKWKAAAELAQKYPDRIKDILPMINDAANEKINQYKADYNKDQAATLFSAFQAEKNPMRQAYIAARLKNLGYDVTGAYKEFAPEYKNVTIDGGGVQQGYAFNPRTGKYEPGVTVQKTATPDALVRADNAITVANIGAEARKEAAKISNANKENSPTSQRYVNVPGLGTMTTEQVLSMYNKALGKDQTVTDDFGTKTIKGQRNEALVSLLEPIVTGAIPSGGGNQAQSASGDPVADKISMYKNQGYSKEDVISALHDAGITNYDSYVW